MRWNILRLYVVLLICTFSLISLCSPSKLFAIDEQEFQEALLEQFEYRPAELLGLEAHGFDSQTIDRMLADTYHEHGLQPFWVRANGPGKRADVIFDTVRSAYREGLNPDAYRLSLIEKYWASSDATGLARLDILLTLALAEYLADIREGRLNPRKVNPELFASARVEKITPGEGIEQAMNTPDLKEFLNKQGPTHERYMKLREFLEHYRGIAVGGGWEAIHEGETLRTGMNDARVPGIRKRLFITGDSTSDDFSSTLYDEELSEAVRHFQMRYGLAEDGVCGKATIAAMNIPVEALIRSIEMNMERTRWISHDLSGVRVGVTIAGFKLGVFNDGNVEMAMPVIVGTKYHMTPVFSDMIKYIEFNPYWNIPPSIARNEMLPKLKKNPQYLKERNIRVFSSWGEGAKELDSTTIDWNKVGRNIVRYKLRQDPGPENALGTVKFMFPNKYNVYLHDTPSHSLFKKTGRAFSHGCIRVSRPLELASHLLGGEQEGWGMDRIREIVSSRKRTVVPLKKPIPVHITYRTVWIGVDNTIRFGKDVYGRDKLLGKALYETVL